MTQSVGALALSALKSMGVPALYVHKCGRSRFKRSKVWELSLETTKSVGAFTLSVQNVGAPALNIQK